METCTPTDLLNEFVLPVDRIEFNYCNSQKLGIPWHNQLYKTERVQ
jgi:hypothetical protein